MNRLGSNILRHVLRHALRNQRAQKLVLPVDLLVDGEVVERRLVPDAGGDGARAQTDVVGRAWDASIASFASLQCVRTKKLLLTEDEYPLDAARVDLTVGEGSAGTTVPEK